MFAQQPQTPPYASGKSPLIVSVVHVVDLHKLLERIRARQDVRLGVPGSAPDNIINVVTGLVVDNQGHVVTRLTNLDPEDKNQKISITTDDGYRRAARLVGVDCATGFAVLEADSLKVNLPDNAFTAVASGKEEVKILSVDFVPKAAPAEKNNQFYLDPSVKITSGEIEPDSIYSKARGALTLYSKGLLSRNDSSIVTNTANQIVGMTQYAGFGRAYLFPIDLIRNQIAKRVIERNDNVPSGWLGAVGVSLAQLPSTEIETLGLTDKSGVIVREVIADSPAATSGIQPNDVIVGLGDYNVVGTTDLSALLSSSPVGRNVTLKTIRNHQLLNIGVVLGARDCNGPMIYDLPAGDVFLTQREYVEKRIEELRTQYRAYLKVPVTKERNEALRELEIELRHLYDNMRSLDQQRLDQQKPDQQELKADNQGNDPPTQDIVFSTGFIGKDLTPQLAAYFGTTGGILVKLVKPGSAAEKAGLKAGDVIVGAQEKEPVNSVELRALFSTTQGAVSLKVARNKAPVAVSISNQ